MCIKGLIWPKSESCFSPISSDWFIRRITQVLNSGIYFNGCYGNKNGQQNKLKIEKLPFCTKFKPFGDLVFKNYISAQKIQKNL